MGNELATERTAMSAEFRAGKPADEKKMEDDIVFWYAFDESYGPDPSYELGAREMLAKIKDKAYRDGWADGHRKAAEEWARNERAESD